MLPASDKTVSTEIDFPAAFVELKKEIGARRISVRSLASLLGISPGTAQSIIRNSSASFNPMTEAKILEVMRWASADPARFDQLLRDSSEYEGLSKIFPQDFEAIDELSNHQGFYVLYRPGQGQPSASVFVIQKRGRIIKYEILLPKPSVASFSERHLREIHKFWKTHGQFEGVDLERVGLIAKPFHGYVFKRGNFISCAGHTAHNRIHIMIIKPPTDRRELYHGLVLGFQTQDAPSAARFILAPKDCEEVAAMRPEEMTAKRFEVCAGDSLKNTGLLALG